MGGSSGQAASQPPTWLGWHPFKIAKFIPLFFCFFHFSDFSDIFPIFFLPFPPKDYQNDNCPTSLTGLRSWETRAPYLQAGQRPANGRPTGRLGQGSPAGRPAERGVRGAAPPTENLNDFHNDFLPAGKAGKKKSKQYYYNNLLYFASILLFYFLGGVCVGVNIA